MTRKMKYSGIEWIGEVPEDWNIERLKLALSREKELVDKYKGQPILSLTKNGVIERDLINISGKMPASFDGYQKIEAGNLITCLFDIDVTPRCVGIAEISGLTSPAYTQFRVKEGYCKKFLYYYLLFIDNDKIIVPLTQSLRNTIKSDDFLNLNFPSPSIETQKMIVNFLDFRMKQIEDLISKTKESIKELKIYKQSLVSELVTVGLDKNIEFQDSGIPWIGLVPKDWEIKKVRFFLKEKSENNFPEERVLSLYRDYGVIYKNSRSDNHNVTSSDTSKYKKVEVGDLVINKMKAWQGSMGISEITGIISPAYYIYKITDDNIYLPFLHYSLRNKMYVGEYKRISSGLRVGQWDLDKDQFKNIRYAFPRSIDEQKKIVKVIKWYEKVIDKLIQDKENIISEFESYKKTLIYEYITGKKEVHKEV